MRVVFRRVGCGMALKPAWIAGWTGQHARHAAAMFWQGRNPAARVYESIGSDFFVAPAPGWLNLGLWEGPGSEGEAGDACRRLVAVNMTEGQLMGGRERLRGAAAAAVATDAARLPVADASIDGVISVEAAFHFLSRKAFFEECYRVLRPGGVLSISDIPVQRWPVTPAELLAGLTQLRVFGLRPRMAMTAGQIAAAARAAGLAEVEVTVCGDRVIAPALRLAAARLAGATAAPAGQQTAARLLLRQVDLLWRREIID